VTILLILAGVACVAALAVVPFLLPWPQHVRWLVASMAVPDPIGMSLGACPLTIREVSLGFVRGSTEGIIVELVDAVSDRASSTCVVPTHTATLEAAAHLQRWAATRTPLLLVTDESGEASLHGPSYAILEIHQVDLPPDRVDVRPEPRAWLPRDWNKSAAAPAAVTR
jgi:hypothetical protein